MMDWQSLISDPSLNFCDLIQLHIKNNVMRSSMYTCTECGRLKSKNADLSGTPCRRCEATNSSLDPSIDKFTTLVQNQLDIGNCNNKDKNNLFLKLSPESPLKSNTRKNVVSVNNEKLNVISPFKNKGITSQVQSNGVSPLKNNGIKSQIQSSYDNNTTLNKNVQKINQFAQTDVSFNVNDTIVFTIKSNNILNEAEEKKADEVKTIAVEENEYKLPSKNPEPVSDLDQEDNGINSKMYHCQKVSIQRTQREICTNEKSALEIFTENTENLEPELCSNKMKQDFVAESPVENDDLRRMSTSPLLFSQETSEDNLMRNTSNESDQEECIDGTPPDLNRFTCHFKNETLDHAKIINRVDDDTCNEEMEFDNLNSKFENKDDVIENHVTGESNILKNDNELLHRNQDEEFRIHSTAGEENEKKICNLSNKNVSNVNIVDEFSDKMEVDHQGSLEMNRNLEENEINEFLSQSTQKLSKLYKLKIVLSNIGDEDYDHLETFSTLFNPVVEDDVTQDTNFLLVGVDSANKVLKRTPKFLKAISLHVCVINIEYIKLCYQNRDIITLERQFIPLDSSGSDGPLRSFIQHNVNLLENVVIFNMEKNEYLASVLESLVLSNGGILIDDMILFRNYRDTTVYKKVVLYGEDIEKSISEVDEAKLMNCFKATMLSVKALFNCIAAYDLEHLIFKPKPV